VLKNFTFSRNRHPVKNIQETLELATDLEIDLILNLLKFNPEDRMSAD
jgi:hypothetical protein